ncbi:MAG: sigma 54-interacting transcriptional regulator [Sandaracinaceae bacterium]
MSEPTTDVTDPIPGLLDPFADALAIPHRPIRLVGSDGTEHRFETERIDVGSHARNDLCVEEEGVSRFHARITIAGGKVLVEDLGSMNGTFVDGVRVERAYLTAGSVLSLGHAQLTVRQDEGAVEVPLDAEPRLGRMVGGSVAMRRLYARLKKLKGKNVGVLIEGESGTGKELAAECLAEPHKPFVVVDCGALPPSLIASELFGHEKGAFTGASDRRVGAFEAAHGGTVFLDEIGELPIDLQPTLLRVLEQRSIRRVGSNESVPVDVRVIAATNRPLRREVNDGRFRADLYHRLAVVSVEMPPLRERLDDLELLAHELLEGMKVPEATLRQLTAPTSIARLRRHAWPGNVRELRNVLARAAVLGEATPTLGTPRAAPSDDFDDLDLGWSEARERALAAFERRWLERLMERHGQRVSHAAEAAGVARQYLHRLLVRHGLK